MHENSTADNLPEAQSRFFRERHIPPHGQTDHYEDTHEFLYRPALHSYKQALLRHWIVSLHELHELQRQPVVYSKDL